MQRPIPYHTDDSLTPSAPRNSPGLARPEADEVRPRVLQLARRLTPSSGQRQMPPWQFPLGQSESLTHSLPTFMHATGLVANLARAAT